MTYEQQVRKWQEAMDKSMKRIMSEKGGAKKFLIRAGILTKDGKRLAKPYRR